MHRYKVVTISHKTTHLKSLKDYLVVDSSEQDYPVIALRRIKEELGIQELLYLNTCNRVTFFFSSENTIDQDYLVHFFKQVNPQFTDELIEKHASKVLTFEGEAAIRHLFGVAASLDSLVLGEREILGQLKQAFALAKQHQLSGDAIRLAIDNCILFAKKIYSETRIGEKPVSVVSLAFRELLNRGISPEAQLYIIGAGQTNHLMANLLVKYGFKNVKVFNRTLEKSIELAQRFQGGQGYTLDDLDKETHAPDLILTCTGAVGSVLKQSHFEQWNIDPKAPFTILDLAVPADTDAEILSNYSIDYIDVPSLKQLAEQNMEFRRKELVNAYKLLDDFVEEYELKFKERQLELAFSHIPQQVKELKRFALEEVFYKDLQNIDDDARQVLAKIINYMEKKYISIPMKSAKATFLGEEIFK